MSAGKYREKIYRHDHENLASLNEYSLRIVGMSDLGLRFENLENKIRKDLNRFETEERKSRREEIVLCRLRTKKTVMTDLLPYINREYNVMCDHCDEPNTIQHILLDCLLCN